ncbi:MAG: UDP-N-acetylmuramate dehydrogenase [Phycisphaerae bacterium]|nr:UDP-N-acetylmuramate dehydrogenase [Phycisphaerae bacterium]
MNALEATRTSLEIAFDAPIPTWFGIGGRADRLARPGTLEQLGECLRLDPNLRVLGDGANLLVDDDGVSELVVVLEAPTFRGWTIDGATLRAGAGANLPKLINECVKRGLAGLESLGGIPASVGGAVIMNAGGAFGQIADAIARVHALDRAGRAVALDRARIAFDYRHSGLGNLIITEVEFELTRADPAALRERHLEVMAYKKKSQPMAEKSAGCVFKNPTLTEDLTLESPEPAQTAGKPYEVHRAGSRVSAGMLIDRAGLKGLRVGGASVSPRHANFIVTGADAKARDVIELMDRVALGVFARFGVTLHPEVVIWRRTK